MALFSWMADLTESQNDCHLITLPLNFSSDNFGSCGFTKLPVIALYWSGWTYTVEGHTTTSSTCESTLFLDSLICLWQVTIHAISSDSWISLVMSSSRHNEFTSSLSPFSVFTLFSSKLLITSRRFRFEALSSCCNNWLVSFLSLETTPLWAARVDLIPLSFDIDFAYKLCPTLGAIL